MKKLLGVTVCLLSLFWTGCNYSNRTLLEKRIQNMEKYSGNPGNIDQIKEGISRYDQEAQELVEKNSKIGIWYKILGTRYLDKKMYGEALKAFQEAVEIYPDNPNLYYYIGICAGYMSHSALDFDARGSIDKKMNYLKLSESALSQAIKIDGRYANALYALGVLYAFDLDDGAKAVECLEKFVEIETKNTDGMMVLARAYYMSHEFDKACDMYDRIISITKSSQRKSEAEANKKVVLDASYGF